MKINGFKDTIEWYNQNASQYTANISDRADIDQLNQFTELLIKGGRVLDAGCAGGRDTNLFAEKGFEAHGIDLSRGLIAIAHKTYPSITFVEGNFLNIPYPSDFFDGVWAHASLVHFEKIEDVEQALNEFHRVLKFNGLLHIFVKAQTGSNKTAIVTDTLSKHDRFFRYFTIEELKTLLETTGFTIDEIRQYNETEWKDNPRPEVEWILVLARKV